MNAPAADLSYNGDLLPAAQADRLAIVLVSTRNSLNIGAAARAMSNFGIFDLRLVHPWDPSWQEARSAVHAAPLLKTAQVFDTVAEATADCTLTIGTSALGRRQLDHPIHTLDTSGPAIRQHLLTSRAALLFGSEKFGLSNDDLSHCHWLLHIPTRQDHLSMNLGQAVAVCLYELTRPSAPHTNPPSTTDSTAPLAEDCERLTSTIIEVMSESGYLDKHRLSTMHAQVRRVLLRLQFNTSDLHATLGMLRQTLWKLRSKTH